MKLSLLFVSSALLTIATSATRANAQPPEPTAPKPIVVEPAPGQAAASAPSPQGTPITATCSLGDHVGTDADEARTAADVVCHELARRGATNTQHEVRFGRLGGRTMVTLASRNGNTYDERRTFVTGLDEINVAGPRLASALVEGKPLEDTRTVDNVLASETRASKVQQGSMAFDSGIFGTMSPGTASGASAGLDLGLTYRAGNFGIGGHGRAGGIGSAKEKISTLSLDVGAKYFFSAGEFAPFAGAGLGMSQVGLTQSGRDRSGSGFGAHVQLGAEMLRTHHVAFSTSLRVDLPFYELDGGPYVAPLSLNVGLVFH